MSEGFKEYVILMALMALIFVALMIAATTELECQEDMSCWDCSTMGNKICGVPDQ